MALFRNFGVNRRNRLCGIHKYASAQFHRFLELAKNCSFLDRKLINDLIKPWVDTEQLKTKGSQAESRGSRRPVFEPKFSTLSFEP
jgi:hypothetical protein